MTLNDACLPLVSVGVPTFNRAASLTSAIESILSQDYRNIELVISDNASSDETEAICRSFSVRDERVRYVRQSVNQGAFENFRTVLERATGQYFMWLSDDDFLSTSYISRCVEVLESRTDVALVSGIARYHDDSNVVVYEGVKVDLEQERIVDRVRHFYGLVGDNGTFYGLARRQTLLAIPASRALGGDWLWVARLAAIGKILTLGDTVVNRSNRGASADVPALALSMGLSQRVAQKPHNMIAFNVARDILRSSFAPVSIASRCLLAIRCANLVQRRFVQGAYPFRNFAIEVRAQLGRMRRVVHL